jgi:hypothetical protein
MELFAFMPKYHEAPDELVAVLVPYGVVTREVWEEALAARIYSLVMQEDSPAESSKLACKLLNCKETNDPKKLAEIIFLNNTLLKTQFKVAGISDDHFCLVADKDDQFAMEVLSNDTLLDWVVCAREFVEKNKEALLAYTSGTWYEKNLLEQLNPQMLDQQLWLYADYVKSKIYLSSDFQSSDPDEFLVFINHCDFYFSISHHHDFLKISHVHLIKNENEYKDLSDLTSNAKKFNRNHALKLSFFHTESKKFFFKKLYKLNSIFLTLEVPLAVSELDVEKTMKIFCKDLRSFLHDKSLSAFNSSYFENDKESKFLLQLLELELNTIAHSG